MEVDETQLVPKRKAADVSNPLIQAVKRPKKGVRSQSALGMQFKTVAPTPSASLKPNVTFGEGSSRRRSSGARGKRLSSSFVTSGVIAHPHTSVSDNSFYKHIDVDLPESHRTRQLLIWCAHRSLTVSPASILPPASELKSKQTNELAAEPVLPSPTPDEVKFLRELQEETIRMLAEGKIKTTVHPVGEDGVERTKGKGPEERKIWWKPNEQNVKNRRREVEFKRCIERSELEDAEWNKAEAFYKSYCDTLSASSSLTTGSDLSSPDTLTGRRGTTPERSDRSLEKFRAATPDGKIRRAGTPKRGVTPERKYRATTPQRQSLDMWMARRWDEARWEDEVPGEFLGPLGMDLARSILQGEKDVITGGDLTDAEFKLDQLETFTSTAAQNVLITEEMLDHRFALLSQRLSAISAAPLPPSAEDPQDLLRALTRIDSERPPREVGDAARRAKRELQRGNGGSERRLTNVGSLPVAGPIGTPGKDRRSSTPHRERTPGRDG